jgi:hypothetical protein
MFRVALAFFLAAVVLALASQTMEGTLGWLATLAAAVSSIFLIAALRRLAS